MSKPADLSQFQVTKPPASLDQTAPAPSTTATPKSAPAIPERKQKGFRIRTDAAKQLAMLKIETGKDEQDLVADALNMLFERHGKPPIA